MAKKAVKTAAKKAAKGAKKSTAKAVAEIIMDPDKRALFLSNKEKFKKLSDAVASASGKLRAHAKQIKADGFTIDQIKVGIRVETPEGEAELRAEFEALLLAARYSGSALGQQLELFSTPDRTPAVDIAKDEGQRDSMEGKTASPKYDPSTPQHAAYMQAYHDETERRVKAGFSKLPEDAADNPVTRLIPKAAKDAVKAKADAAEARAKASVPSAVPSSVGMTRTEYMAAERAKKAQAKAEADALFASDAKGSA